MKTAELSDEASSSLGDGRSDRGPGRCRRQSPAAMARGSWRLATILVFALALAALVPTTGDFGLTWDEPAYYYSQVMSVQWWEQLVARPVLVGGPHASRCRYPPLLLALRQVRHQLSSPACGPVEPGSPRDLRLVDEGHPLAADGLGDRVRPDHCHRLPVPGPPVRDGCWPGHGRLAPPDAAALRPGSPDRHGYSRAPALGRHGPGLLERTACGARQTLAGAGRDLARPGVRREDGRGRGDAAALALAGRRAPAPDTEASGRPGRLDRRRGDVGTDAPAAGPGLPGDSEPAAATANSRAD